MDSTPDACIDIRAALPLFVGGDLDRDEALLVEEHLSACDSCRQAHRRAEEARAVLLKHGRATGTNEAPDLWPGIRAALAAEEFFSSPTGVSSGRPRLVRGPRLLPVGLLSAAAAVWLAFFLAGFFQGPGAQPRPGELGLSAGRGGTVTRALPVGTNVLPEATGGGLRPLSEGEEPLYLRAREMRAEQGLVAPLRERDSQILPSITPASGD